MCSRKFIYAVRVHLCCKFIRHVRVYDIVFFYSISQSDNCFQRWIFALVRLSIIAKLYFNRLPNPANINAMNINSRTAKTNSVSRNGSKCVQIFKLTMLIHQNVIMKCNKLLYIEYWFFIKKIFVSIQ